MKRTVILSLLILLFPLATHAISLYDIDKNFYTPLITQNVSIASGGLVAATQFNSWGVGLNFQTVYFHPTGINYDATDEIYASLLLSLTFALKDFKFFFRAGQFISGQSVLGFGVSFDISIIPVDVSTLNLLITTDDFLASRTIISTHYIVGSKAVYSGGDGTDQYTLAFEQTGTNVLTIVNMLTILISPDPEMKAYVLTGVGLTRFASQVDVTGFTTDTSLIMVSGLDFILAGGLTLFGNIFTWDVNVFPSPSSTFSVNIEF